MRNKFLIFFVFITLFFIPFITAESVFNRNVGGGHYRTDNNINFSFSLNAKEGLVSIKGLSIIIPQDTCRTKGNITVCLGRINSTDNEHYRAGLRIDFNSAEIRIKSFVPKNIIKWTEFNITITAENNGKATARNFVMEINIPENLEVLFSSCPFGSGRISAKGSILQGSYIGCSLILRANSSGRYRIPIKFSYFNGVKNKKKFVTVHIPVKEHDLTIEPLISKPEADLGELLYYALILRSENPIKINNIRIIMPHFMILNLSGIGKNLEWSGYVNGTKRFDFRIVPNHYGYACVESIINYTFQGKSFSVKKFSCVNITGRPLVIKKYNNKSRTVMLLNRENYGLTNITVIENSTRIAYYDKIPAFSHEEIKLDDGNVTLLYVTKYGQRIKDEFLFYSSRDTVSKDNLPADSHQIVNYSNFSDNITKGSDNGEGSRQTSVRTFIRVVLSFLLACIVLITIWAKAKHYDKS